MWTGRTFGCSPICCAPRFKPLNLSTSPGQCPAASKLRRPPLHKFAKWNWSTNMHKLQANHSKSKRYLALKVTTESSGDDPEFPETYGKANVWTGLYGCSASGSNVLLSAQHCMECELYVDVCECAMCSYMSALCPINGHLWHSESSQSKYV